LQVWYLEAPVFEGYFGPLFGYLDMFHSAFGILDLTTGINYTVEYDAMQEVPNATFPFVFTYPNGSEYLQWFNGGGICVSQGVNDTYYNHKKTLISVINGTQFNSFINWLPSDNNTYNHYETWCVYNKWDGTDSKAFIASSTCVDFNWRGFGKLYELGAKFNYDTHPRRDFINLYAGGIKEVNYWDPLWNTKIIKFYKDLYVYSAKSISEMILWLIEDIFDDKFVYSGGKYYLLDPFHYPFLGVEYRYDPLPGTNSTNSFNYFNYP